MSATTPVIGRNELIDIVDHATAGIPAKIDTGADSCAIWASNIREHNNKLEFTLFGAGSVFYTGEEITTDQYKVTSVKNSFGEKELRYTVWLTIRLQDRRFKVRFNLADRSNNHFPVLLGKRFLNRKFLVDVSKSYLLSPLQAHTDKKVLVLAARTDEKAQTFFDKVAAKLDAKLTMLHYDELVFEIGRKPRITVAKTGEDLGTFNMVYFKSHKRHAEQALAIAAYLRYKNVISRDEEVEKSVSHSKLSEMMQLSIQGLSIPETVVAPNAYLAQQSDVLVERFGLPLICKDVFSDQGKHNHLVHTAKELRKTIKKAPDDCLFAVQKYIPNDGFYRLFVLGREVVMSVHRKAVPNKNAHKEHLNKPHGGHNATLVETQSLEAPVITMALRGAAVMQRQVAGIDVLQDKDTGKWYILEVNASPQFYTPKFSDEKVRALAKYLNTELERW